jgi:hypothetical protein
MLVLSKPYYPRFEAMPLIFSYKSAKIVKDRDEQRNNVNLTRDYSLITPTPEPSCAGLYGLPSFIYSCICSKLVIQAV